MGSGRGEAQASVQCSHIVRNSLLIGSRRGNAGCIQTIKPTKSGDDPLVGFVEKILLHRFRLFEMSGIAHLSGHGREKLMLPYRYICRDICSPPIIDMREGHPILPAIQP